MDANINSLTRGIERILMIDDELSIVKMNKTILEQLGYHVTSLL